MTPPKHFPCRCYLRPIQPPRTEIGDLGSKAAASILLADRSRRIVVPSREEWIGINLLERDDELPKRRR